MAVEIPDPDYRGGGCSCGSGYLSRGTSGKQVSDKSLESQERALEV